LEIVMISVVVNDENQVAEARREVTSIARQHGFNEVDVGRVALVATELATNLIKHAREGEILVGSDEGADKDGIQILALDKGCGMADVRTCLAGGYSSAGTAGHGLGAVNRQSTFVDVASWPEIGTVVLARIGSGRAGAAHERSHASFAAVSIAKSGEDVCGDAGAIDQSGPTTTLFVADGLGHGPNAAEAAVEAVRLFRHFRGQPVSTLLEYINSGLRATRGAAVSIARHDPCSREIIFGGSGTSPACLPPRMNCDTW
jgi:anti-sigma regulatory factor (Ser/Thr protein kinase)